MAATGSIAQSGGRGQGVRTPFPASLEQQWSFISAAEWWLHTDTRIAAPTERPGLLSKPMACLLNLLPRPLGRGQGGLPPSPLALILLSCSPLLGQSRTGRLLSLPTPRRYLDYITRHQARQGFGLLRLPHLPDVSRL